MKTVLFTALSLALSIPALGNPLQARFDKVCAAGFVLSPKAKTACVSRQAPKVLKSGKRFAKPGIGEEINTLARQLKNGVKS